ncbi:hypothetical protein QR680_017325 [Steinernema hermaphroditum]|uniref:Uncharacterized protein n=1 Tax=Steinernema hermaphroditum TaxID=289476 RepID=A0AA39LNX8_9BILA|nr:hypothetical protein QR680_017325 [Steinernema hermaphroditum]
MGLRPSGEISRLITRGLLGLIAVRSNSLPLIAPENRVSRPSLASTPQIPRFAHGVAPEDPLLPAPRIQGNLAFFWLLGSKPLCLPQ